MTACFEQFTMEHPSNILEFKVFHHLTLWPLSPAIKLPPRNVKATLR
jgi:hypothetical protein